MLQELELRGGEGEEWDEAERAAGSWSSPTLYVLIPEFSAGEG